MLSVFEMEDYHILLLSIQDYQTRLTEKTTLKAVDYSRAAGRHSYRPDTIGGLIAATEKMRENLAHMQRRADKQRPEVEQTIRAAVDGIRGSSGLVIELAMKLYYLSGREWMEIGDLLHTGAEKLRDRALKRLSRIQEGWT
ncbi:MAG: hypothetical protein IKO22_04210 [Oscillospiraceae bacterium]|nr:hypothetical protein [Oscillospiraceae bacterium]